ncbi:similar to Saccharomyces cerevisiae YJR137C MET5 Sulfite reductase beta subunit, involved in amino acid biosynthesis, transcription repressed by methionine [Maudiozyma saulgeensis]|uniref:Sulfite reductase [NADPH] subunit beta n=1 Tax=Maudiozyma saulgeensis TaxID=1789683 RepID=A0A1X7R8I9_9SACH|nr:similar to Saccharomyces cerevisiae YJR137C MET5 Sulfite reductase beta subunit, involved in amino acid biosynthesis, transcription repressed by methionine [Kazachstania saulgeensis]
MTVTSDTSLQQVLYDFALTDSNNKVFYTTATKTEKSDDSISKNAIHLLNDNDPFATILETVSTTLTTIFTDEVTLLKSLPHLYQLRDSIVVNVDLSLQDYSIITALKDLNIVSLISNDAATAVTNAQLASKVALERHLPVFHFINFTIINDSEDIIPDFQEQSSNEAELEEEEQSTLEQFFTEQDISFFELKAKGSKPSVAIVNLSQYGQSIAQILPPTASIINVNVYRPWSIDQLLQLIAPSVSKIVMIQGSYKDDSAEQHHSFDPFLLDFFADFQKLVQRNIDQVILTKIGQLPIEAIADSLDIIINNAHKENPVQNLYLGKQYQNQTDNKQYIDLLHSSVKNVLNLEAAYIKVLKQLFSSNLEILNEYSSETVNSNSPEYGFGYYLKQNEIRQQLIDLIKSSLDVSLFAGIPTASNLVESLSKWLKFNESFNSQQVEEANKLAEQIFDILNSNKTNSTVSNILKLAPTVDEFSFKSHWLIGSDAWSYDLGNSGVHNVLSSNKNINMLLIDSEPYTSKNKVAHKKNVGLYAMNYHNVYVASVAVYSSYTQLLTAMIEAAKFNGPSLVLAYLPYSSEADTPLDILKETKIAVESGYWPLYRYDPTKEEEDDETHGFTLDSSIIKKELQDFLDRENKLTLLIKKYPIVADNIKNSASDVITRKQETRNKAALDDLLEGLSGPPLHIYYSSDGSNSINLATRLCKRAVARGLKATVLSMEQIILDELPGEENVIFFTSTAGQGEFPQDGKSFWDELKSSTIDLAGLNVSVFGLGDSKYWPRKEDARYYNKPSKDLAAKLEVLGANFIVPLGLGDDQDADGFQEGYQGWEPHLWEALGVDNVDVPDEPKPWNNEDMKLNSDFLRGTIVEGLNDESTLAIHPYDQQLTKFHGCYMQDDRDIRDIRKAQGLEPLFSFMSRVRLPGGKATPEQWLALDKLATEVGNGTMKISTRATFQLHGILKKDLKHAIRAMNSTLMDTLAACGDVNRNVVVTALPTNAKVFNQVSEMGTEISEYFLPKTTAYHEIWLQGTDGRDDDPNWPEVFANRKEGPTKKKTLVSGNALVDVEPIYSNVYLPRKFKVNIAVPPFNDVDVFAIDLGLIAIVNPDTQIIEGYNLYAGGGMGSTHNNTKTYPRTGSEFGFVKPEDVIPAIQAVMIIQRDNGDRQDRKHARLKYTIDDIGVPQFKAMVEEEWGKKFEPSRSYEQFISNHDYFGWVKDETGLNHYTCFIENGRVADTPELPQKTGLVKIAKLLQKNNSGHFRLTATQHVLISDIEDRHLDEVKKVLKQYKLDITELSGIRIASSSCVGLPTCGLAMAESERYLPVLIDEIEEVLEEFGLRHDSIVMRMTGCPNGCSRPWVAEIALIGKAPHTYNLMLGGGYYGQRLNKLYRASVKDDDIIGILKPLFKRWALEREEGEHFGDFVVRAGIIKPTLEGKYFHDDISEDAY